MSLQTLELKKCIGCKAELPLSAFPIKDRSSGTRRSSCITCMAVYKAEYYKKNKERHAALGREWVKAHPENVARIKRKYFEANRASVAATAKAWGALHPEKKREYAAKYRENNRDLVNARKRAAHAANPLKYRGWVKAYIRAHPEWAKAKSDERRKAGYFSQWKRLNKDKVNAATRNRRARIAAVRGEHSAADIGRLLSASKGKCYWCHGPLGAFQVDHVWPVAQGGENHVGNLCLSCPTCNQRKGSKAPTAFAGVLL